MHVPIPIPIPIPHFLVQCTKDFLRVLRPACDAVGGGSVNCALVKKVGNLPSSLLRFQRYRSSRSPARLHDSLRQSADHGGDHGIARTGVLCDSFLTRCSGRASTACAKIARTNRAACACTEHNFPRVSPSRREGAVAVRVEDFQRRFVRTHPPFSGGKRESRE